MKIVPVLIFCGLLGLFAWFDSRLVRATLHQHAAETFPHVSGTVIATEVTTNHTSRRGRGTVYHFHINYRYVVAGVRYRGYRYRYDGHPTDQDLVNSLVIRHPSDSAVDVYYNPENPKDSLLSPGVDSKDVAVPFFIAALGLFSTGGLIGLRPMLRGAKGMAGGVKLLSEKMVTRVRLPRYEPLTLACWSASGLCLAAAGLGFMDWVASPWLIGQCCFLAVLLGAGAVYIFHYRKLHSGRQDLVIDEISRTLRLPQTYDRYVATSLAFAEVVAVEADPVRHQNRNSVDYSYLVTLKLNNGNREKLVNLDLERAAAFGAWLAEKIGVEHPPPQTPAKD